MVESCGLDTQQVNASFRHETNAPYRVIEKALAKDPLQIIRIAAKVLDVFWLINCTEYIFPMAAW